MWHFVPVNSAYHLCKLMSFGESVNDLLSMTKMLKEKKVDESCNIKSRLHLGFKSIAQVVRNECH